MIHSGLVSITFRGLSAEQIVTLVGRAGLDGIAWGGDAHVPHGDLQVARYVGGLTRQAGLAVASYGSYYRAGESETTGLTFSSVLDTALALGAPGIRVWAGAKGLAQSDAQYHANVVADLQRITALAEAHEIVITLEHHDNTLTEETDSAVQLIQAVDTGNIRMNWQPAVGADIAQREESLGRFLPFLSNLHVFHWLAVDGERKRLPLTEGIDEWRRYLEMANATGRDHYALIEFVKDDRPEQFLADAEVLKRLIRG